MIEAEQVKSLRYLNLTNTIVNKKILSALSY